MRNCRNFFSCFGLTVFLTIVIGCGGRTSPGTAAASPTPVASPTPSSSAPTVLADVQNGVWQTCGACGNTGGTGPVAGFSSTNDIASPSEDSLATEFSLTATVPFTNAYFFRQQKAIPQQLNALTYEFDLYIPTGMETAPQAVEFECQQTVGGWVYNFAWQAEYTNSVWRIFDYGLKRWDATPVTFTHFTPGTWHHIVAEYHNDTVAHTVIHDALTVDGTRVAVNITHNAFFSGGTNQFTNAFQLDSNSTATAYNTYVDKMKITYQ